MSVVFCYNAIISLPYVANTSRDVLVYLINYPFMETLVYKRTKIGNGAELFHLASM